MVYFWGMKQNLSSVFKNIQGFSLIVGMAFGAAIGLVLFSYLVPNGERMIGLYHNKIASVRAEKNKKEMVKMMNTMGHDVSHSNPYAMGVVNSEKQFLADMVLHHEAAVMMAEQVLIIPGIRQEVKDLANEIIRTQVKEVSMMKNWLNVWKW